MIVTLVLIKYLLDEVTANNRKTHPILMVNRVIHISLSLALISAFKVHLHLQEKLEKNIEIKR